MVYTQNITGGINSQWILTVLRIQHKACAQIAYNPRKTFTSNYSVKAHIGMKDILDTGLDTQSLKNGERLTFRSRT